VSIPRSQPTGCLRRDTDDIREQASWGRLISDAEWGTPILSGERSRKLPFVDITDAYERSVA
jgi:hypothetical protein